MRGEPWVTYRFSRFHIEFAKTKSDSIKVNQTKSNHRSIAWIQPRPFGVAHTSVAATVAAYGL
jgi:hypothetical protein